MSIPVGDWERNDVNVPMLEPFRWYGEIADGRDRVASDLGALALLAFSGPAGYVLT